jgi:phospholipid/cholesterol/gamma-HCH transport system permease protein
MERTLASIPTSPDEHEDPSPFGGGILGGFAALAMNLGSMVINFYNAVVRGVMAMGDFTIFVFKTLGWMFTRLPRRGTIWPNFYEVGVSSLPVIALTGTFIGMVLAVQSYFQFRQIGLETRLGAVINMTLLRELGPVLAATMLAGRVGSAMAAELGTMRVTQQIDALAAMGVNPVHYLVVPRFMACLILIPTLTIMADFMGVAGGHFYSVDILGIDIHHYWHNSAQFVTNFDLFAGLFKSVFFGSAIAMVSCYQGFNCSDGAEGVGSASTNSFVYSFVAILVMDLFLNIGLDSIYFTFYPEGASLL